MLLRLVYKAIETNLKNGLIRQLQKYETSLSGSFKLLNSYSHINVLKRGFSIIKHDGKIIKSSNNLKPNYEIELQLYDGARRAKII